jgi:HEAT repeat protein
LSVVPTREDIDLKERGDRALRAGRAMEALALYRSLLRQTEVFEPGVYESWLEGALTAYKAMGRKREAGYVLLALRRFADAESSFDAQAAPVEWALAAARRGQRREAAARLAAAGHPALAALELDGSGDAAGARALWERVLREPRLRDRPYETALVWFHLGETLHRLGDQPAARRAFARAQELLEGLADEFERRGQRERAFDCYNILLRLGRDAGSFENVAEGYLNIIRLQQADDQKFLVLQYYEDFLAYAVQSREWQAAATLAREAAEYCLKVGLMYERHYRQRAATLFAEAARQSVAAGNPPEMAENALSAAIDAASELGDLPLCGELYREAAELPLAPKRKERYAGLAARLRASGARPAPGPAFPDYLRRSDAYQDIWRQDVIEWELDGRAVPVLAYIVVERVDHPPFARAALLALLKCVEPGVNLEEPGAASELADGLGAVRIYEVLRPLEHLVQHAEARVRERVMWAVGRVYCKRSFGLVRQGLADPEQKVRDAALNALGALHFRDGLDPLMRIFRESTDERVREVALDAIASIGNLEAGYFLLDVLRRERGPRYDQALRRLRAFPTNELLPSLRHLAAIESGPVRRAIEELLGSTLPARA